MPARKAAPVKAPRKWPVLVLATIAWAAVAFDYYDRHTLEQPPSERPLAANDARLDLTRWAPDSGPPSRGVHVNGYVTNKGAEAATGFIHLGSAATGSHLAPEDIDGFFAMLHAQMLTTKGTQSEIQPGTDIFFTIPPIAQGIAISPDTEKAIEDGTQALYVMGLLRYRDSHIADGEFIYTESCAYFMMGAAHVCENHNRSYIFSR